MIFLMAGSKGFDKAYDALTQEYGGPLPPDMLGAFMDEWETTHDLEVSA